MVARPSHRVSRARQYSGAAPKPSDRRLRGSHPLWPAVPGRFGWPDGCSLGGRSAARPGRSSNPATASACRPPSGDGLGWSPFARRYLGSRSPFLGVLRWFSSPGALGRVAPLPSPGITRAGLPHSDTPGSPRASPLPGAFRRLAASFLGLHRLGIHRAPSSAWPVPANPLHSGTQHTARRSRSHQRDRVPITPISPA